MLTFIVGSVWITLATIIAERAGTKLGGIIAGLPSTMLIALFFIGWTQTPVIASRSTTVIPIVLGINALFIVAYVLLLRSNVYLAILSSLIIWFILAMILIFLKFDSFIYSLLGFALLSIVSYYVLEIRSDIKSEHKRDLKYTFPQILSRGILSGIIICFALAMAKIGGPLLGGIFASFPAVTLSTMIITHSAQGKTFSAAVMKVLMMSATVSGLIYAVTARYFYLHIGLIYGTLVSFMISLTGGYFIYTFVDKKVS